MFQTQEKKILKQTIWMNSHIKIEQKVIYYKNWYQKGVKYIHDLLGQDGSFLSVDDFNIKYGLNVNFIMYYGILSAIPNGWKQILNADIIDEVTNETLESNLKKVSKQLKVPKYVYHILLKKQVESQIQVIIKWQTELNIDIEEEEWFQFFNISHKASISSQIREFQFKFLHRCIYTNDRLFKWKLVDSDKCVFCKTHTETFKHFFWECEFSKNFWNQIFRRCSNDMVNIRSFSVKEVFFGNDSLPPVFNLIFVLGKKFYILVNTKNLLLMFIVSIFM